MSSSNVTFVEHQFPFKDGTMSLDDRKTEINTDTTTHFLAPTPLPTSPALSVARHSS